MTEALARAIADRLLVGAVEGAIVIVIVWTMCRRLSALSPAARAGLWWLASLNLVLALLPLPAVRLPLLPMLARSDALQPPPAVSARGDAPEGASARPRATERGGRWIGSADVVTRIETPVVAWFVLVLAQAGVLWRRSRRVRGVVQRAVRCSDDSETLVAQLAGQIGLRRIPDVRVSVEIDAPQVTGIRRPTVLLPARAFTADEQRMMLCHELMHVRRRDLALGWVPAVAERLFFFHPLARLAAREYVAAREAACDAAVVRVLDVRPTDYGRMLIRFGVGAPEPALTAGGSPASKSSLRRRLEMLQHDLPARASRRTAWLAAGAVAALVPLQLVARGPQSPAAPAAVVAQASPAAPARAVPPVDTAPAAPATVAADVAAAETTIQQLLEQRSRQEIDADSIRRQRDEAERVLSAMQDFAEQRRYQQEIEQSLEQLAADFRAQLAERQLAAETRRRERERAELELSAASVLDQLEQLRRQQEILLRQLEQVAKQQDALSAAQIRLNEETERIRQRLEAK